MKAWQIEMVRALAAEGKSNAEINDALIEAEIESAEAEEFEDRAYGTDYEDNMTYGERVYHDRLSMGRNEAGEWLGFM